MWTHLLDLAERLDRAPDAALLAERFPAPRYVHVTRRDKVAQAVSLWRAVQTRAWRAGDVDEEGGATYHGGAIGHLATSSRPGRRVAGVVRGQRHPSRSPSHTRSSPPTPEAHRVGGPRAHSALGPAEIPAPPLRRQGDDRSDRWVERYRGEVAA